MKQLVRLIRCDCKLRYVLVSDKLINTNYHWRFVNKVNTLVDSREICISIYNLRETGLRVYRVK